MLFSTITRLLAATALVATGAQALDYKHKDVYMANYALEILARINTYRTEHTSLTDAQVGALDLMEKVVARFDIGSVHDAEEACVSAFGREECSRFSGQAASIQGVKATRAVTCGCATLNNWCKNTCKLRKNSCGYASCEFSTSLFLAVYGAGLIHL